jgi:glycosyltransferase involved in cell wall biosynthesis
VRDGRRVAVVVPALDEEASVAGVVRGFRADPFVDQVLVVDNASRDRTAERARAEGALVVREERPGYGAALRTGIEHALGLGAEIVVLAEADGTFDPSELERLVAPLDRHALVLGSRTQSLRGWLGLGNRAVAAGLAALWPRASCRLTDVGCTYRAFTAAAWRELSAGVDARGPEFSPQMICEAFRRSLPVLEVPVRYLAREGGASKHTGGSLPVLRTAARMLVAILAKRREPRRPRAP